MSENKILTVRDVKEMFHMGNSRVYRLFTQKSFPSFRINDSWYVKEDDLMDWCDKVRKMPDKTYSLDPDYGLGRL